MTTDRWTQQDEAELKRLTERKRKLFDQNVKAVRKLVINCGLADENSDNIAENLALNADAFRDALEPFDSGVRTK